MAHPTSATFSNREQGLNPFVYTVNTCDTYIFFCTVVVLYCALLAPIYGAITLLLGASGSVCVSAFFPVVLWGVTQHSDTVSHISDCRELHFFY